MDADQFQQLLAAFAASQQQLIARLQPVQIASSSKGSSIPATLNPLLLQPFEQFDSHKENFKNYIQRFENYLQLKNAFSNKTVCAQMLLTSIGPAHYNTLAALVAPKTPPQLSYDELLVSSTKHLSPKKNVLVSQHRFLSLYQSDLQSISDYVASLRKDLNDCDLVCPAIDCQKSIADIFLRAQFIRGIKDNSIREKLLQSELTEFDKIFDKALALEASKLDSRELSKHQPSTSSSIDGGESEVKKISHPKFRSRSLDGSGSFKNRVGSRSKSPSARSNYSRASNSCPFSNRLNLKHHGIENLCLRCGNSNHDAKSCRINPSNLFCDGCSKSGHVKKVCISTLMMRSSKSYNSRQANSSHNIDISSLEDLDGVNKIIDIFEKTSQNGDNNKYFVDVKIEGKTQSFEVDSGAGLTLLPEPDFLNLRILTSSYMVRHSGNVIEGCCTASSV